MRSGIFWQAERLTVSKEGISEIFFWSTFINEAKLCFHFLITGNTDRWRDDVESWKFSSRKNNIWEYGTKHRRDVSVDGMNSWKLYFLPYPCIIDSFFFFRVYYNTRNLGNSKGICYRWATTRWYWFCYTVPELRKNRPHMSL